MLRYGRGLHTLTTISIFLIVLTTMAYAQPTTMDTDSDFLWYDPELFTNTADWIDESMMMPLEAVTQAAMARMVGRTCFESINTANSLQSTSPNAVEQARRLLLSSHSPTDGSDTTDTAILGQAHELAPSRRSATAHQASQTALNPKAPEYVPVSHVAPDVQWQARQDRMQEEIAQYIRQPETPTRSAGAAWPYPTPPSSSRTSGYHEAPATCEVYPGQQYLDPTLLQQTICAGVAAQTSIINHLMPPTPTLKTRQRRTSSAASRSSTHSCSTDGCVETFRTANELYHHQRNKHTDYASRPCACTRCDKRFLYPKDLRRHERTHEHGSRQFYCHQSTCKWHTRGFGRQDHLDRHVRDVHNGILGSGFITPASSISMSRETSNDTRM